MYGPALLLINPDAGATADRGPAQLRRELSALLSAAVGTLRVETASTPALVACCRALPASPGTLVIVCGGDGTVAAVAGALAGTSHVLLPLPGGTANLYCRDLGLATAPQAALEHVLAGGSPTVVDVGWVTAGRARRAFLNQVVFGLFAEIAERREQARGSGLAAGPDLLGTLFGAVTQDTQRYALDVDGEAREISTTFFVVALNDYDRIDAPWPGRSRLNGGHLALYVGDADGTLGFAALLARCLVAGMEAAAGLERSTCSRCCVASEMPLNLSVDGEPLEVDVPVELAIEPGALRVLTPAVVA